jgi:thioredoxin reductase (NADPH)
LAAGVSVATIPEVQGEIPQNPVDLAIIGGGPVGLFAAFYAGMRQMSVNIIDSLEVLGGQLVTLYPEKYIYDVAGFPKVLAKDLAANLIEQGLQYGARTSLGEQITELSFDPQSALYALHGRTDHVARTVIICAGIGSFQPKTLPLPNADQFHNRGLYYAVTRLDDFKDKHVLIVGGGDSAVDWANAISPIARNTTLIHRRDGFRAHEDSVAKMKAGRTNLKLFYELKSIAGNDRIEQVTIYDNRTKREETFEVDAVLVNIGFNSSLGPILHWGLEIDNGQILVNQEMGTNRPGIFAAGDVAQHPGKLKLIATGFAEACIAVNYAKHYIDPKAQVFPGHSSNMPH